MIDVQQGGSERPVLYLERREVEAVFHRSIKTLFALPGRVGPSGLHSGWPSYVREYIDAYDPEAVVKERFKPTPQDISNFLDVLAWGRGVDRLGMKIVIWKALGTSFRTMGDMLDVSHETARMRYEDAVDEIWRAAHSARAGC